jgi:hypothetical protein
MAPFKCQPSRVIASGTVPLDFKQHEICDDDSCIQANCE